MAVVSMSYAQALFDSVKDKCQKELSELSYLYETNIELKNAMNSPRVTYNEKMEIIKSLFKNDIFVNFISLIIKENRINMIADINDKYSSLIDSQNKKINIEIYSSDKLSEEEISKIVDKYKTLEKASMASYNIKIDKSLIGGIKVITGDKVYDGSVKAKLEGML